MGAGRRRHGGSVRIHARAAQFRLVTVLQERQTLLERLFRIQRSISHRQPVGEVLDSITEGAAELLGDDTASLRIIDETTPGHTLLLSSTGIDRGVMSALQHAARLSAVEERLRRLEA